jgi:DNA-binding beta-propeller fold protein YncE
MQRFKLVVAVAAAALSLAVVGAMQVALAADDAGGELWANSELHGKLYIIHGMGSIEEVHDPALLKPHLVTFAPSGEYAYVSDVGNGRLNVVRADDRTVVESRAFPSGGADTHEAKAAPDGNVLLVARRAPARTLHKVLANEGAESWTVAPDSLTFGAGVAPVCTVFRSDGQRAYVSLSTGGIAVVDVGTMTLVTSVGTNGVLGPTDGLAGCNMAESKDGRTVYVASRGGGGHLYKLDTTADTLTEVSFPAPGIGAIDLHSLELNPNESVGYANSRGNDRLKILDLTGASVATVPVDATEGVADSPDGIAVRGNTVYIALKDTGKLAVYKANQERVTFIDVAPPGIGALPHVVARP